MTEEKGNTIQESFNNSEIPYPAEEVFSGMLGKLHSEFYGIDGKFVVTIEFHADGEVDSE